LAAHSLHEYTWCPEVRRPTMDTFTELRQLADDLTEFGDAATAMPVHEAIDRFSAWSRCTPEEG